MAMEEMVFEVTIVNARMCDMKRKGQAWTTEILTFQKKPKGPGKEKKEH